MIAAARGASCRVEQNPAYRPIRHKVFRFDCIIVDPPGDVFIYLDTYMLLGVYEENEIRVRNHCGAEPPRDLEPPGLVTTVGWRDRASTSYAAADRVKAPARAARGRFRGIHGGRTAPFLPAETRTASGGGCLAGSVPSVLVCSRR